MHHMATSRWNSISRVVLVVLLCLLISFPSSTTAKSPRQSYLNDLHQCLIQHSDSSITSGIYLPGNSSYSTVLRSYIRNLRFNTTTTPKPILILTALHESHIQSAVICAKHLSILMKIRSGGHDYEGLSYISLNHLPFFVLDMFHLRSINIDIKTETAWVQAGATLGELYYRISQASNTHGFPAGVCPTVGVGGHLTGGGYGNMMRKYGLTIDHIVDAQLVNVNGQLLDRKSMGEDLFWAIRGGGAASFGVVVAYKINLVRVPETVTVFKVERTMEMYENESNNSLAEVVSQWQKSAATTLPHELFIRLTFDVVNGTTNPTKKTVRATFRTMYLGDATGLLSIMSHFIPNMGVNRSDCHEMSWVKSTLFWTDFPLGTQPEILLSRTPQSLTFLKRKSDYVKKLIPRTGFELIWRKMIELETPQLTFNPYGGRMAEIAADATPFPHRAGNLFKLQYATNWGVAASDEVSQKYIELTRMLHAQMTPYVSKAPREAFLNYRDIDLGVNHQGKLSYLEARRYGVKYFKKDNFERLVKVKTKVDPDNFFRNEQSIPVMHGHN